ncbi:hypothetical protein, partial [Ralstonia pseudosolanacearum]|uniref:hypothetical protein n=1 Tax=Ralstonia pseudosolanacearum TaxID=1310165 RepID=UPI003CF4EA3B
IPFAITTPDKLLEVIDKINAPAAEEVEETSAEEKAVEEPLKVEKVAAKVEDKIIPHEEKKKLGKIVTNFIGYELDVHI